ncbi:hypothetical protein EZS27_022604 [termite gut metagenome]|uniref:Protein NO VEIN C-terminal domain-containing protein n=1 Tax=termite gut metagenome TaxID=433724 RepID=A0A5J4R788_9ZZZZ
MSDYHNDNSEYYDDIKNTLGNKQHADKIIDKIKGIDSEQAKRAVWELVQNARDIAIHNGDKKTVNITVELYDDCLIFKHDGKWFDYKTLFSLIIQVSSKDKKNDEEDQLPVGQFGTGFCTTHAFGRIITLNGSFQLKDGKYVPLTDFILDRQGDSDELAFNINEQIKSLDKLTKQYGDELPNPITSLKYTFADDNERQYAHIAVKCIDEYVSYVFALNNTIQSLEVKIQVGNPKEKEQLLQYETKYTQCSINNKNNIFNGLFAYTIHDLRHPDVLRNLLYIDCDKVNLSPELEIDKKVLNDAKIILPISLTNEGEFVAQEIQPHFARIFIFFPLIGSQHIWGTTFMMHSPLFTPATDRNGVFLVSEAPNVQINQSRNRRIIEIMNTIIFSFLGKYANQIQDVYHIAKLSFPNDKPLEEPLTDIQKNNLNYYGNQRSLWQSTLMNLPIVRHNKIHAPQSIVNSAFFAPELINDSNYADDIYKIVSLFWENIPLKDDDEYRCWTEMLSNWNNDAGNIKWIELEDIAEQLQEFGKLDKFLDEQILIRFYLYTISVNKDIFGSYELLPNLKGEFRKVEFLKKNIALDPCLLKIANDLGLATSRDIVDRKFMFDFEFDEYTGQILNKALLDKRDEIEEKYQDELRQGNNDAQLLNTIERETFLKLCSVFPPNSSGIRSELMPHICNYWKQEFVYKEIESQGEEHRIRYDDAFLPFLFKDLLIDLQSKDKDWNEKNLSLILEIIKCAYRLVNLTSLIKEYPSFLNQNYQLKKNDDLYYEKENINGELKNIYNSVFKEKTEGKDFENYKTDYDIKDELLHSDFYLGLSTLIELEKEKKVKLFFEIAERGKDDSILASEIYSAFEQKRKSTNSKSILTEKYKDIVLDLIQRIAEESSTTDKYWSVLFNAIEKEKAELFLESASDAKQGVIFKIMRQNDETIDAIVSMMEDDKLIESLKEKRNVDLLKKLAESPEEMEYLSNNLHNIKQIIKDAQEAERNRKEEEAHKKHIKDIGKNIQNQILSILQGYKLSDTSDIKDEQGGQDFIIRKNGTPVYYIEVKSRWNSSRSIRLSKRQSERALNNRDIYAVIIVDLATREDKEDYFPGFDKFKPFIKVLTSVGDKLESIVPPIGIVEDDIFHIEDYNSTIEQKQFEKGIDFDKFIEQLKNNFS